jgi:flagellar motor switch protein FliN/FliY
MLISWGLRRGRQLAKIDDVDCDISVVLGTTPVPIHQLLRMGRGAIIELGASEDDEVTILANNMPVAKGTVVVEGSAIAVSVTRLLPRPETLR